MLWNVIDFEGSIRTGIVETAVYQLSEDGSTLLLRHTRMCAPDVRPTKTERDLCGLPDIIPGPPFQDDLPLWIELRNQGLFVGHGISADRSMLKRYWPMVDIQVLPQGWGPWIDTHKIAKELFHPTRGDLESLSSLFPLDTNIVREMCPEDRRRFHAAPWDAGITALLLQHWITKHKLTVEEIISIGSVSTD